MCQATSEGVGICQCRARKVQPIELWGFLAGRPDWPITGPALFALGFARKFLEGLD